MGDDNDVMAPAFHDDGLERQDAEASPGPLSMISVSIENDTSWLAGGGVGYHLQVHNEDGSRWVCVRRYSEFASLRELLIARCQRPSRRSTLLALAFPEKRWMGGSDLDTVRERRRDLERWMNGAIAACPTDPNIGAFLSPDGSREDTPMTPGGSGSINGSSGALGSDAEDWAELEKVRVLRESLLRSQLHQPGQSACESEGMKTSNLQVEPEPEPEPEPGSTGVDDDFLERLIQEAAADAELDSNFSLPPLRDSALAVPNADCAPSSPLVSGQAVAVDVSQLATPPRSTSGVVAVPDETTTPTRVDQQRVAEKNASNELPQQLIMHDAAGYEHLLRTGGKQLLEAVCAVLDRVVPLLDVPQKHTPRRRRRLLEDRVEKLLELLRPTGSGLQQRWAAAAALMQLEPNVASTLAGDLAKLASLPIQSAYTTYTGLSASAVVTLASVLRTLELATAGHSTGNLLGQEVLKKLSNGGENAVDCVAAALDHCLALVDVPHSGASRRYRRALEHDVLEAQSCLERGLGLKIAGRGLQPPLLDALVQAIASVQQIVPSELITSPAGAVEGSSPRTADADEIHGTGAEDGLNTDVTSGDLLSDKTRLDNNENNGQNQSEHECFSAMQRLLRLLICPDSDPEVIQARAEDARVTELRVARRREQRITAMLAQKTWGPADDCETGSGLATATERLRLQQEEEASAILRMRQLEAEQEIKDRQEEEAQARLALNRRCRARTVRRRRQLRYVAIIALAGLVLALKFSPAALQYIRTMARFVSEQAVTVWAHVHGVLGPSVVRLRAFVSLAIMPIVLKLQPMTDVFRQKMQVGVELWAWMIDGLVHSCLRALPVLVVVRQSMVRTLRLRVLLPSSTIFRKALALVRRR